MTTQEIVSKLCNLCNVLRDDGITYQNYLNELTYILFLKMCSEIPGAEEQIPEEYRWAKLVKKDGIALKDFYKELLDYLGTKTSGRVLEIYAGSQTSIDEPKNLEKIIKSIDALDWFSAKDEGLGDLYEGLLEKNATEKKERSRTVFYTASFNRCNDRAYKTSALRKMQRPGLWNFWLYDQRPQIRTR